MKTPEVIFEAYQPDNVTEMREYNMYLISLRLQQQNKAGVPHPLGKG